MPTTLTVQGRRVTVDDSFRSLTPEQQESTVDEIARSMQGAAGPASRLTDEDRDSPIPDDLIEQGRAIIDEATQPRENNDMLSEARVVSGGLLEGIPVVGPMIRGGVDRAAAATIAPFSDRTYGEVLEEIQAGTAAEKEENPWLDTGSQIAGAVAGTAPMVMAAPAAFGAGSGSLLARSAASAATGTAIGAGDAAVRSDGDAEAIEQGALWGLGLGAAGPAVGQVAGAVVRRVGEKLRPSTSRAEQAFARAAGSDAVDTAQLADMGADAMPMDLGPNLQRQAGALAATPGRGQEIIRTAIAERQGGSGARVTEALNKAIGRPVDSVEMAEDIITARAAAAKPAYEAVYDAGEKAIWSPELERLSSSPAIRASMRGAVNVWRDRAIADGFGAMNPGAIVEKGGQLKFSGAELPAFPNLQFWDYTKRILDDKVRVAIRAGQSQKVATLAKLASTLRDELDKSVPAYKAARETYSGPSAILDALEEGQKIFTNSMTPGQLRLRIPRLGEAERDAFEQGARAEIAKIMGTARNDALAARSTFQKGWNKEKLRILLGEERADEMLRSLDSETAFTKTRDVVTGNSETAARLSAKAEIDGAAKKPGLLRSAFNMRFGDALADTADKGIGKIRASADDRLRTELAELLTTRDPAMIKRAQDAVATAQKRGDITAERAKQIISSLGVATAQQRQPLEITVTPSR